MNMQHTRPASNPQKDLIARLLLERELDLTGVWEHYEGDSELASLLIDKLFAAPRRNKTVHEAKLAKRPEPGLYVLGDQIIRVQQNKAGTGVYALRLVPSGTSKKGTWEFERGLIDRLEGATPASREDMVAYGRRTATCGICGAHLENPESVERGIGPICAGRI